MAKAWTLVLTLTLALTMTVPSLAQFDLTTQLSYGGTGYGAMLDKDTKGSVSEWSAIALGTYTHQDLLFNAFYQSANRLSMQVGEGEDEVQSQHGRSTLHFGAAYQFLEETGMKVYGGLGYSLMWLNLRHPEIRGGEPISYAGQGFAGQAVVQFELAERFTADALITAAPWFRWEYTQSNKSIKQIDGSAYSYQLGLEYDISEQYAARLGIQGGSYKIDEFEYAVSDDVGPTRAGYSGVTVGVTWHF